MSIKKIHIKVTNIPPHKDISFSIRNPKHPAHQRFLNLRIAAKKAMGEISYHKGPVEINFHYVRKNGNKPLWNYLSGICDTLGGSHGFTFHWNPIVFLDDCQVTKIRMTQEYSKTKDKYFLEVKFL